MPAHRLRITRRLVTLIIAAVVAASAIPARAASPEQVDAALAKAKDFLFYRQQHHTWERHVSPPSFAAVKKSPNDVNAGQWGEQTGLAAWALLAAGESPQNDQLQPAIEFLQSTPVWGTYAMGARTQTYPYLPSTPQLKLQASEDLQKLLDAPFDTGWAKGFYTSLLRPTPWQRTHVTRLDTTASLYGVLGVRACERTGAEVPIDYWQRVEDAWTADQDASGGWTLYGKAAPKPGPLRAAVTAAALSVLYITQDHLHADAGVECKGNIINPHIHSGLQWLTDHFKLVLSEHDNRYSPYGTLFDIEHVGTASGRKFLGTENWYDYGCNYLLKSQQRDGSWNKGDLTSTCFAMLFLAHGRAPVVLNKLQYDIDGTEGNWNERPRDAANLANYIGRQTERELKWQVVNLNVPQRELHDAPILYLAGNQALHFSTADQQKLKQFCEEGGLILGNADGGSADFANSFRELGSALFPEYEFRELPPDSPIYTVEQYRRGTWNNPPTILALSNGVREMMLLYPDADPARYWQLDEITGREPFFQSADDIFLYATDRQNRAAAGKSYLVEANPKIKPDRRIKLARLQYDGNYNPEPGGWQRISAILHNDGIRLEILPIKLGAHKLGSGHGIGAHVAHMTGTTRFKLSDDAKADLKRFVDGGGTLIVDAAGGSGEFADAARDELGALFGPDAARQLNTPVAESNPVFHLPGGEIDTFGFRAYGQNLNGAQHGPQLRMVTINDRPAIYFSRDDLSAGLVGEPMDGIIGYDPQTATDIMRNLVISAGLGPDASITPPPKPSSKPVQ